MPNLCPPLEGIAIDVDEAELGKNIPIDGKITGDIREILSMLCEELEPQQNGGWMEQIAAWKKAYPLTQTARYGVLPQQVIETLDALTPPDTIITTEVGQHQMWAAQFYRFAQPRTLVTSGGLGTMGFGLGAAIGSAVGNPQARVVNIAGDGSFHMNMAELSTAAKYRIPIIEMVFNNSVLGMVRQWQTMFYEKHYSQTNLENPTDYELLAKALGLEAFMIREERDIEPVLRAALDADGPVLINCIIDKDLAVLPRFRRAVRWRNPSWSCEECRCPPGNGSAESD
ncbi:MAG: thiamine pyrophosphate-binding protein [Oscillospiraceae bacterium]